MAEKQPSLTIQPQAKNIECVTGEYFFILSFVTMVLVDFNGIGFNRSVAKNVKYLIGVEIKTLQTYEKLIFLLKINSQQK